MRQMLSVASLWRRFHRRAGLQAGTVSRKIRAVRKGAAMRALLVVLMSLAAGPLAATVVETSAGRMEITPLLTGLEEPWAVDFLPDGRFLVTERDAVRLTLVAGSAQQEVSGLPAIYVGGQGGLLDVMVPRDFASSREVWLSYAVSPGIGAAAAVGFGHLSEDAAGLTAFGRSLRAV